MSAVDLRFGDYRKVLRNVDCDACILDAPYSARTHAGHDEGTAAANRVRPEDEKRQRLDKRTGSTYAVGVNRRKKLNYPAWTPDDVAECVDFMVPRTRGWFVSITDHVLAPAWEKAFQAHDLVTFSPLAFIAPGSRVRISGDGPTQWSVFIVVARPSTPKYFRWGSLPGGYVLPKGQNNRTNDRLDVTGGKPLWLMQTLVRDYSRPGETVCDPCAGGGTTLLAAAIEGRAAVGAEKMREQFNNAEKRFARGYTPTLSFEACP